MGCSFFNSHEWKHIALDSGTFTLTDYSEKNKKVEAIINYYVCDKCNERKWEFVDKKMHKDYREYFEFKHITLVPRLTLWMKKGELYHHEDHMTWIDESYKPGYSFRSAVANLRKNGEFQNHLEGNLNIERALNDLEAMAKLAAP